MVRKLATYVLLLSVSLNSFAGLSGPLKFTGQNAEAVKFEQVIKVIRPVPREVPSTCTRQVPYQTYACHDVTRTREECHRVPAEQECNTEYDRQCRSVTRYREECTRGPSRQECYNTPTRQVCTDRPSRRVCTQIPTRQECSTTPSRQVCTDRPSRQECSTTPSREVCTDRPAREVCRTRPDGQQHCTTVGGDRHCTTVGGDQQCRTVGGGQDCRTVGGDQQCRTVGGGETCADVGGGQDCRTVGGDRECRQVEGDPVCRQVSYSDQECENVPRQACHTIPAHNECNQIPYTEEVCGNETAYRTESYACTETKYEDKEIEKKVSGNVNVTFKTNGLLEEFNGIVSLVPNAKGTAFEASIALSSEPKMLVILKKAESKIRAEGEKEIKVDGEISIELQNAVSEVVEFPVIESATLDKKTNLLSVLFAKILPTEAGAVRKGELDFLLTNKGKEVAKLQDKYPGVRVELKKSENKDLMVMNLKDLITGSLSGGGLFSSSKLAMKLQLKIPSKIQGTILNAKKPQTEKLYENIKVKKK
ncbi:MAG: hypothetical protein V4598_06820 [Bdellovibrionota bacterium]